MTDVLGHPATDLDAGTEATRWRLGEGFLLRVAGRPAGATTALRTDDAVAWTRRVFDREAERDAAGRRLREELEKAIVELDGGDRNRVALINLRRDVFNARRPRPATLTKADPLLPPGRAALLAEWTRAMTSLDDVLAEGTGILDADIAAARARARAVLADDALRCAVLLQSEVLERSMDRYLDPGRRLDKSGRQIERTLLELLYRAALKTSPFSTLTSVGLGRFTAGSMRPAPQPTSLRQRSTVRLNVAVLARLSAVILADPELRSEISVALAPGASTDGEITRYVRRRTTAGAAPDAVVALDDVHEDLFFLPSGPALNDVVTIAGQTRLTLRELSERVATADDRSAEAADRLVGHLLRLGFLLAPDLQIDLRSADPAAAFATALAAQVHPTVRRVAAILTEAGQVIARYGTTPARGRAALLTEVRRLVREAFDLVGAPDRLVPHTLLYEDTTITGDGMATDRGVWEREALPSLATLADILPAFDLSLPRRLTALGFFRARYGSGGRCDDVERFCHEFQRDFFSPYGQRSMRRRAFDEGNNHVPQENWFKLPEIAALDRAREAASLHLRGVRPEDGTAEEIRLGPEFAAAVRAHLSPVRRFDQSWSFFVQLASATGRPGDGRLVLNQAYSGMTLMFSRFAHSLDEGGAGARRLLAGTLRRHTPPGAVLAELRGGYETTNLNIHPCVTDYEIVCPGDISTRPHEEQIPLDDIVMVHDEQADRVRLMSKRLGREVIPLYLGFLLPMALPEVQQVLLCFAPGGMAQIDLWAGTGEPVPAEGITMYPRLVLGDLVLQRRMWKLDTKAFPFRDPRHTDAEHLLRVHRWRREHSLPDRVFAQIDASGRADTLAEDSEATQPDSDRKTVRKPLPVDFDSWMSLQLLEQLALGASSRLVLTECSPDVDELWLHDEHERAHVGEFLIELYDTPRGQHG
ncbi:lantibiotic dehydratase [Actinomadura alba]|uniref:Lantibiotic dehydratase n=1 Tax=Actinomadura alba TaxID=406431 RepID=A0ABR7LTR1_9ACTN|nr:lantibiotic dehydratase [Actinomadura alba]MBC6467892.1 lantibiotic dehydratase [Actinomadura alba]